MADENTPKSEASEEKPAENAKSAADKPSNTKAKPASAKKAAVKKPVAKKPAEKKPAAKKPAEKKPAAKKPAEKKPAAKKPAEKKPAIKKPAEKKSAAKEPAKKAEKAPNVHFVTGFPGFIGRRLVARILADHDTDLVVAVVQEHLLGTAKSTVLGMGSDAVKRVELVTGDITLSRLGLPADRYDKLLEQVTTVWHLAAVYDLSIDEQIAYRVNVVGTSNILDFCEEAKRLERHNYISTCYVAGDRAGLVLESELDVGQGHKNHYESTKFWAELEVQRRWGTIPTAIFRPGIVVGDSNTGETDKYDGPYFLIQFLSKLPSWLPFVNMGQGDATVNLVPVDYVVDAIATIAPRSDAVGKVFQLGDPNPMRTRDIIDLILRQMGRRPTIATVPPALFEGALKVGLLRRLIGIPHEAVIYFNHPVRFDVSNTLEALENTDVRCPHFSSYVATMIDYVARNPEKGFLDGRTI